MFPRCDRQSLGQPPQRCVVGGGVGVRRGAHLAADLQVVNFGAIVRRGVICRRA